MYTENIKVTADPAYPLDGLLTLPDGTEGPFPAVVMVHGSGPSNKDERVLKLTPFKDLAEGLAKRGIASLRYDKRTFAYGRKMAVVGEGNINFGRVFEKAEAGGTKYMLVEQDDCNGEDPIECLRRSYQYLRSWGFQ